MSHHRLASKKIFSVFSRSRSVIRQALYQEDLARARRQTSGEKLKIALELSELCLKLRRAIQTAEHKHGKS